MPINDPRVGGVAPGVAGGPWSSNNWTLGSARKAALTPPGTAREALMSSASASASPSIVRQEVFLADEEKESIRKIFDKWNRIAHGEGPEPNKRKLREAVNALYKACKLKPPRQITYVDSVPIIEKAVKGCVDLGNLKEHVSLGMVIELVPPGNLLVMNLTYLFGAEFDAFRQIAKERLAAKFTGTVDSISEVYFKGLGGFHQLDSVFPSWGYSSFATAEAIDALASPRLSTLMMIGKQISENCGGWSFCTDNFYASKFPLNTFYNDDLKPHNERGPALEYPNGDGYYYLDGFKMQKSLIMNPDSFGIGKVMTIKNIEKRRTAIDFLGYERLLKDVEPAQVDGFGTLYKTELVVDAENLCMIKVVNSTPESDGTYKDYFLRVPPDVETAEAAVAWSFDMQIEEYAPVMET